MCRQGSSVVEQRTHKPLVAGSIPAPGTILRPFDKFGASDGTATHRNAMRATTKWNEGGHKFRPVGFHLRQRYGGQDGLASHASPCDACPTRSRIKGYLGPD
jgi:hypothetical protein